VCFVGWDLGLNPLMHCCWFCCCISLYVSVCIKYGLPSGIVAASKKELTWRIECCCCCFTVGCNPPSLQSVSLLLIDPPFFNHNPLCSTYASLMFVYCTFTLRRLLLLLWKEKRGAFDRNHPTPSSFSSCLFFSSSYTASDLTSSLVCYLLLLCPTGYFSASSIWIKVRCCCSYTRRPFLSPWRRHHGGNPAPSTQTLDIIIFSDSSSSSSSSVVVELLLLKMWLFGTPLDDAFSLFV